MKLWYLNRKKIKINYEDQFNQPNIKIKNKKG